MTKTLANQQLGFDAFLAEADADNRARRFEKEAAHLPGDFDEVVAFLRRLIEAHHAAMLAADVDEVFRLREEAVRLAVKLNGGENGILASEDAPGCRLSEATKAEPGRVPLWGQQGSFVIPVRGMEPRVEMCGLYGIGVSTFFLLLAGLRGPCRPPRPPVLQRDRLSQLPRHPCRRRPRPDARRLRRQGHRAPHRDHWEGHAGVTRCIRWQVMCTNGEHVAMIPLLREHSTIDAVLRLEGRRSLFVYICNFLVYSRNIFPHLRPDPAARHCRRARGVARPAPAASPGLRPWRALMIDQEAVGFRTHSFSRRAAPEGGAGKPSP